MEIFKKFFSSEGAPGPEKQERASKERLLKELEARKNSIEEVREKRAEFSGQKEGVRGSVDDARDIEMLGNRIKELKGELSPEEPEEEK